MYQISFNGYPLHDPRDVDYTLRDVDVHLAIGEAGSVSFDIDPGHTYAGKITRLGGVLELREDSGVIYRGRVRKDTRDFYLTRRIETEGLLACLNDSIVPPFAYPDNFVNMADYQTAAESGNVVEYFLRWLVGEHNSQVGPAQQIALGSVTVTDPNNYISRASSEYLTTWEVIQKKLVDLLGGYIVADYPADGGVVLNYYAELPLTNVQEVEYGENLLDLVSILDSADTYTAILPVGADGLTLADLPDGEVTPGVHKLGLVLYSAAAEADLDGCRITRTIKWDDVTQAANLQSKAAALLTTDGVKTAHTLTVKAVDLGAVDDVPRFRVGRLVRLTSTPHGFSVVYPLSELDPDIADPGNTRITLGATVRTASGIAHADQSAAEEKLEAVRLDLNKQQGALTEAVQVLREQITTAVQNSESIIFEALTRYVETSNFEEYKSTIAAELAILADRITLKFTETAERITEVDGDLQKTLETLYKHFQFDTDGLSIRAGENAMALRLDNGLISFTLNGQQFGWWDGVDFHTGNIVIEVNERAQFGNFAAIPRTGGNLSWLKVGG